MVSIRLISFFNDEKTKIAEQAINQIFVGSIFFVDRIGPGRNIFNKVVEKYGIKKFPAIVVRGRKREIVVREFDDENKLRKTLEETFLKVG